MEGVGGEERRIVPRSWRHGRQDDARDQGRHVEFAPRRISIAAIDKATLFGRASQVAAGDIIGFASRRQGLDYYHTGFIAFAGNGDLLLRSASLRHGRVLDEKMSSFVAANPVKYVTLLRAAERAPVAERR